MKDHIDVGGSIAAPKTHELKTWPAFFEPMRLRIKMFEIRKDDRGFALNDYLYLREWDPDKASYTGRYIRAVVTYLMRGPILGLEEGWVILGVRVTDGGIET